MNVKSFAALSLALTMLSGSAIARVAENESHLVAGEFSIHDGETKTLAQGDRDRDYRICVDHSWRSVPLRVMHDGLETTVRPGGCANVKGKNIAIMPGEKLAHDTVLLGRYRVRES